MCALLCESRICSTLRQKDSVKGHTKMSYEGSGIFSLEKKSLKEEEVLIYSTRPGGDKTGIKELRC